MVHLVRSVVNVGVQQDQACPFMFIMVLETLSHESQGVYRNYLEEEFKMESRH